MDNLYKLTPGWVLAEQCGCHWKTYARRRPRPAMTNPRPTGRMRPSWKVLCGPVEVFAVVEVLYILTTCPDFDDLEFDIFVAGGPQCHFITSVTIAVRIRTFSVH